MVQKPIHAYGMIHRLGEYTGDQEILRLIDSLEKRQVKRLGVEVLLRDSELAKPDLHRLFWFTVKTAAEGRGIKLVQIEKGKSALIYGVVSMLGHTLSKGATTPGEFKAVAKTTFQAIKSRRINPEVIRLSTQQYADVSKIVDEVLGYAKNPQDLRELMSCLNFMRSNELASNAAKEKLEHYLAGAGHVRHSELQKQVEAEYFPPWEEIRTHPDLRNLDSLRDEATLTQKHSKILNRVKRLLSKFA